MNVIETTVKLGVIVFVLIPLFVVYLAFETVQRACEAVMTRLETLAQWIAKNVFDKDEGD